MNVEKYEDLDKTENIIKEEFYEIDNLSKVGVQMFCKLNKEVDRLIESQKECEWGSTEWKNHNYYIQSLWTTWYWFYDTIKEYTDFNVKRSDIMRKIVQTLNNEVFFEFNRIEWVWKYKNKTAILDKNIVDELNELWYTLIRRGRAEVFVDFSKTKYIGKFLSERGDI